MTAKTNDTALALLKARAIQAIRDDGARRTEITVDDFKRLLRKRCPREQGDLCKLYLSMTTEAKR